MRRTYTVRAAVAFRAGGFSPMACNVRCRRFTMASLVYDVCFRDRGPGTGDRGPRTGERQRQKRRLLPFTAPVPRCRNHHPRCIRGRPCSIANRMHLHRLVGHHHAVEHLRLRRPRIARHVAQHVARLSTTRTSGTPAPWRRWIACCSSCAGTARRSRWSGSTAPANRWRNGWAPVAMPAPACLRGIDPVGRRDDQPPAVSAAAGGRRKLIARRL